LQDKKSVDRVLLDKIKKEATEDHAKIAPKIRKAPLTDTAELVRQVRSRLHTNGISQKVFGDVVLGVSPGGVSELLTKPKPWEHLSPRARDLYLVMNDWLDEPNGITRLQAKANLNGESNGQKRSATKERSKDDRWQQDLAELIRLDSKSSAVSHSAPTMVTSNSANNLIKSSSSSRTSSLDKAIERLQKLRAAKQS
uniref:CUT domain-containing protein n=1 Tax=Gongylonema pulchrum TaxID=637853 RepID=A0A183EPR6_9BILA